MTVDIDAEALRTQGNEAFKKKEFDQAQQLYSRALKAKHLSAETRSTLLSNRAACWIKLDRYEECEKDCIESLNLCSASVKSMYRLAVAQHKLRKLEECVKTLKVLIQIEPHNHEALELMRTVRSAVVQQEASETMIAKILHNIQWEDSQSIITSLQGLMEICKDDPYQSREFVRKGGLPILEKIHALAISKTINIDALVYAMRLLALLTNHKDFVDHHVDIEGDMEASSLLVSQDKVGLISLAKFLAVMVGNDQLVRSTIVSIMNILKVTPASRCQEEPPMESSAEVVIDLVLSSKAMAEVLKALKAILSVEHLDTYVFASDTLSALISDLPNFYEMEKLVDARMESLEERKRRAHRQRVFTTRSKAFVEEALSLDLFHLLARQLSSEKFYVRSNAVMSLGKLIKYLDDADRCKTLLQPHLSHPESFKELVESKSNIEMTADLAPFVEPARQRAALEAALLVTHPELGTWALQQEGGIAQLLLLIGTQDAKCLEIAAEVLCLAAGVESANDLLASLVRNNVIQGLLHCTVPGVRAAAASVMTKLSLKAKALSRGSEEVGQILNAVSGVLKANAEAHREEVRVAKVAASTHLVSFSHHDNTADHPTTNHPAPTALSVAPSSSSSTSASSSLAATLSSLERSVEVVAAIVGQTFVKEELVHGSSRIAPLIADLTALEIDPRSTAAYGLAHILAALTVTNRELKILALKDKELTLEQYEKMQELQRIKAEQEDGTVIEERKEEEDNDTQELCKLRIRKIVQQDGIKLLLKLVEHGSQKTKETACRALRQICVDEVSRGLFIQQGALKMCCSMAADEGLEKPCRLEAAHAVAKALVTTNPHVLSEHLRLASMRPLLFLCKEVDATPLQQFEALLSLTNLLSCGQIEQDKFVAEKGVHAVHYLMFSSHLAVRRAATEAFCNMPSHEALLKILRKSEDAKLWLAFAEDWHPDPNECQHKDEGDRKEAYMTARAAAATLAMAANDEEVVEALLKEDVARTVVALLQTQMAELIHRALALTHALLASEVDGVAMALLRGGVVPAMAVVTKTADPQLATLARECAQMLSAGLEKSSNAIETTAT